MNNPIDFYLLELLSVIWLFLNLVIQAGAFKTIFSPYFLAGQRLAQHWNKMSYKILNIILYTLIKYTLIKFQFRNIYEIVDTSRPKYWASRVWNNMFLCLLTFLILTVRYIFFSITDYSEQWLNVLWNEHKKLWHCKSWSTVYNVIINILNLHEVQVWHSVML